MPRRTSKKDTVTFYYAYKLGKKDNEVFYSEIYKGLGQLTSNNGIINKNYYGEELQSDSTLVVQDNIKHIDNFTKIWLQQSPLNNNDSPSHKVVRITNVVNGLYTIYLKTNVLNYNTLWYEINGNILEIEVVFDYDNLTARIDKKMFLPIDITTNVWYIEPNDSSTTENKLQLLYKEELDDCIIFKFKEL